MSEPISEAFRQEFTLLNKKVEDSEGNYLGVVQWEDLSTGTYRVIGTDDELREYGWDELFPNSAYRTSMATYTCGGVTGHAQNCDRATCEIIAR